MKKAFSVLLIIFLLFVSCVGISEVDISGLTIEELLELQLNVNGMLKEKASFTLLPGIYDCEEEFLFNWYNCKVLPGPNGEERVAIITFRKDSLGNNPWLTYEISSLDEGIKLSMAPGGKKLLMTIEGAALEAVPFGGM